jgi:hypothetical protein
MVLRATVTEPGEPGGRRQKTRPGNSEVCYLEDLMESTEMVVPDTLPSAPHTMAADTGKQDNEP